MTPAQDAFAALRYRDFSIVTINQFCLTLAILIQEIIVAYSLYQITKDPLTLGLIGLAEAIPFIALSLWGGYFADKLNKQTIMKVCLFFSFPLPLVLWWLFHSYDHGQIGDLKLAATNNTIQISDPVNGSILGLDNLTGDIRFNNAGWFYAGRNRS